MGAVEGLEKASLALNKAIAKKLGALGGKKMDKELRAKFAKINVCLMDLSRILLPILSSKAGKYGQDPMGSKFRPLPGLQAVEELASTNPESDEFRAWRTSLVRERNKVSDALHSANTVLGRTLDRL